MPLFDNLFSLMTFAILALSSISYTYGYLLSKNVVHLKKLSIIWSARNRLQLLPWQEWKLPNDFLFPVSMLIATIASAQIAALTIYYGPKLNKYMARKLAYFQVK